MSEVFAFGVLGAISSALALSGGYVLYKPHIQRLSTLDYISGPVRGPLVNQDADTKEWLARYADTYLRHQTRSISIRNNFNVFAHDNTYLVKQSSVLVSQVSHAFIDDISIDSFVSHR